MDQNARQKKRRRQQKIALLSNIIFCLITLAALTGCIVLLLSNYSLKNQSREAMDILQGYKDQAENYIYTQADLESYLEEARGAAGDEKEQEILNSLKEKMSSGTTTVQMLRDFFPENIVVYADGSYHFFEIDEKLKKNHYVLNNFKSVQNGQIEYVNDADELVSKKGIDVSKYQGKIQWNRVAADGVEYAFIRAGVRGSTEGKMMPDDKFEENIEGALENNIQVGVYFFTQALNPEEAKEEAEFVIDQLKGYDITYPVVLDLEEVTSANARTKNLTQEEYTENAIAFLETIKDAGYTPMIYGNLKTFLIMLDMEKIEDYSKWFAYYNTPVYFPYEFDVWQYSSTGTIDGIKGDVDLNICMKDFE